jgi:hypothetical protein
MKAITLNQPSASLVFGHNGIKIPELNRSFGCDYKGDIAIHASAGAPDRLECQRLGFDWATIPRSAVLGIVRVTRCYRNPLVKGRFIWVIQVVEQFPQPIPARGARLLWNWERP